MQIANIATFDTSLPNDSVIEEGQTIEPNGRTLAEIIAAELREKDWSISVVEKRGDTGWSFWGKYKGVKFWCLIGFADPWILIVADRRFFLRRWFAGNASFVRLLEEINTVLRPVEEISNLIWLTEHEYESARENS